jgi:hypothetical protein
MPPSPPDSAAPTRAVFAHAQSSFPPVNNRMLDGKDNRTICSLLSPTKKYKKYTEHIL